MSDLMREEFEAWVQKRAARSHAGYHPRLLKRCDLVPDCYAISWVDSAFEGWQASRECLVIEMPAEPECPEDPDEAIDDSHMDAYHSAIRMRNACRNSIHAAGVKTK